MSKLQRETYSKFVLGTAQLGMEYGRTNKVGKSSFAAAVSIVKHALACGVTAFDTARAYGDSEAVLGEALVGIPSSHLRVITKLDLAGLSNSATYAEVCDRIDSSIQSSCHALRVPALDALLLHSWEHGRIWNGAVWKYLSECRDRGLVKTLGVSVYEPKHAMDALLYPAIQHLQIPLNVLDWRWKPIMEKVSTCRPEVVVHARSVFLQGILVHSAAQWPVIHGFDNWDCAQKLSALAKRFGRIGPVDLCLAYVRSKDCIAGTVIGCDCLEQLDNNLELFAQPKLTDEQVNEVESTLPRAPVALLNPTKWSRAGETKEFYAS